jgi:hypothetical protein
MPLLGTFITLDSGFATTTLTTGGSIVSDLSPILTVVIGVLLGVTIVALLIGSFHKAH